MLLQTREEKTMTENAGRHPKALVIIHWLTALLILGAWVTAEEGREVVEEPPLLHFTLGLAVLALIVPRLVLRMTSPMPADPSRSGLAGGAAKAGHALLYLLMIGLPLTGWYVASQMGVAVSFAGIDLPAIAAPVQGRPGLIAELHESAGTLILVLAGLHMLLALWHQFALRDGTLSRMSLR